MYAVNNLYELAPWLKHTGNVLLLLEPQTPSRGILELFFPACIKLHHNIVQSYWIFNRRRSKSDIPTQKAKTPNLAPPFSALIDRERRDVALICETRMVEVKVSFYPSRQTRYCVRSLLSFPAGIWDRVWDLLQLQLSGNKNKRKNKTLHWRDSPNTRRYACKLHSKWMGAINGLDLKTKANKRTTPDKGEQRQRGDFSKVNFRHWCQEPKSHSITSTWLIHPCIQPNHMADNHLAVEAAGPRSPVADHVAYIQDDQWRRVHSPCTMEQQRQH